MLILAINPGSTSMKIAIFEDEQEQMRTVIRFDTQVLNSFQTQEEQNEYRLNEVSAFLQEKGYKGEDFDCVVARGGDLKQVETGAYLINERMLQDISRAPTPQTQGVRMAYAMMHPLGRPCMIYDAVSADEWEPETKLTGIKGLVKKARQHTLNSRRVVFEVAKQIGKPVDGGNFIVAHIGGGTDVSFFRRGRLIETLGYNDLGFSPERCGAIQFDDLLELAGKTPISELLKFNHGTGGLVSLCGTADIQKIQEQIQQGDQDAELALRAMTYRIAQIIGAGAVALRGDVDAVILTGGGAFSDLVCGWIQEQVRFIAPVHRVPGEMELEALAMGALRVLRGEEQAKNY